MSLFRRIKNKILKYFNDRKIIVYKYYNHLDDLERVEVYYYSDDYNWDMKKFKCHYLHEWERYVNVTKYRLGKEKGVWIEIYEGYDMDEMVRIKREFYTK